MLSWKNLVINLRAIPDMSLSQGRSIEFVGNSDFCNLLFTSINQLQNKYEGEIFWRGHNVKSLNYQDDLDFRKNVTLVFAWGGLLSNQTLEENILIPLRYHGKDVKIAKEIVIEFFKKNRYYHFLQNRPYHVPFNLRKLTSIIRGLLFSDEYVFIEDICLGLEENDIKSISSLIESIDKTIYFYDSLGKFELKNTDSILLTKRKEELIA